MKKTMTVLLASIMSISSVLASDEINLDNLIPADELEATMSDTDTSSEGVLSSESSSEEDIELNDRWNPGRPYPGRPYPGRPYPGRPYPGRPYPGNPNPGRPYPGNPGYSRVVCYATNGRGMTFDAVGQSPRRVQQWALDECYRSSRYCRASGCHRIN